MQYRSDSANLIPKETLCLDSEAYNTTIDIYPWSATMNGTNSCSPLLDPTEVRKVVTSFEYTTPASKPFWTQIYWPVRKGLKTVQIDTATSETDTDVIRYCISRPDNDIIF